MRTLCAVAVALALQACTAMPKVGPDYQPPQLALPETWQAPASRLPHGGGVTELNQWWARWEDPAMLRLIDAAQAHSPTLPLAAARIARAQADAVAAGAASQPQVDGNLAAKRAAFSMGGPLIHQTTRQAGLMANWEVDLFGGLARGQEAAQASLEAASARWHEARVSLAAETAHAYLQLRLLERRLAQAEADARSRLETARVTLTLGEAGLQAPAQVAQAEASAAEARSILLETRAQREMQIKALVALTGMEEGSLRSLLAEGSGRFPGAAQFGIEAIPARVLAQRPDLAAAERDLAAASAAIGQAEAARYPRLQLAGSITPLRLTTDGTPLRATTWSIGPSLTLPLLDGGLARANADAARAQYAAAEATYRQKARDAVREVEQALIRLSAASDRESAVRMAADRYQRSFTATETRHRAGLASLLELEDSRRVWVGADLTLAAWQQEEVAAWIALYRAVGGGWEAPPDGPAYSTHQPASQPHPTSTP